MKKTIKTVLATALVVAMTSMAAFAQSYTATAWTIRDDVDYSMNPRYFQDAEINNFLLNSDFSNNSLNLTFAKQFNNLYLGTTYNGNFWGWQYSSKENNPNTKTEKMEKNGNCFNNISLLLGFKNMGVKLFYHNYSNNYVGETSVSNVTVTNSSKYSNNEFEANWGGSFDLSSFTLKPNVFFNYSFSTPDNEPKEAYNKTNTFFMGLGSDFVFTNKAGLKSTVGVDYTLSLPTTKNYDSKDTLLFTKSTVTNKVSLSYLLNYSVGEKTELGAKIRLTNTFNSSKIVSNDETTSTSFEYSLLPILDLGTKYKVTPSFNINVGARSWLPTFDYESTSKKVGKENVTTKTKKENASLATNLYTGFEWNITKGLTFDTSIDLPLSEYFRLEDDGADKQGSAFNKIFNSISIGLSFRK